MSTLAFSVTAGSIASGTRSGSSAVVGASVVIVVVRISPTANTSGTVGTAIVIILAAVAGASVVTSSGSTRWWKVARDVLNTIVAATVDELAAARDAARTWALTTLDVGLFYHIVGFSTLTRTGSHIAVATGLVVVVTRHCDGRGVVGSSSVGGPWRWE